ncbi:hypothetical protein PENFLA_c001G00978 [Penicillium flavigenum]|uniref:Uncharacterized protein n=1 Tax=Penicillium flavigenum TaxID=254877 RepID=A0A1V6U474_9EURO|nr:hypothetical protein PENFLA_c001G00978 [Penicillium flavigenum]
MQLNKCLILLATCATTAFSAAVPDAAAADECSNLGGVMSMETHKLPEGVSLSDLRKCVEHPHGRERFLDEASLAPFEEGPQFRQRYDATFVVQIQYCLATKALAHPWARDDDTLAGLEEWSQEEVKVLIQTIANKAM